MIFARVKYTTDIYSRISQSNKWNNFLIYYNGSSLRLNYPSYEARNSVSVTFIHLNANCFINLSLFFLKINYLNVFFLPTGAKLGYFENIFINLQIFFFS